MEGLYLKVIKNKNFLRTCLFRVTSDGEAGFEKKKGGMWSNMLISNDSAVKVSP